MREEWYEILKEILRLQTEQGVIVPIGLYKKLQDFTDLVHLVEEIKHDDEALYFTDLSWPIRL